MYLSLELDSSCQHILEKTNSSSPPPLFLNRKGVPAILRYYWLSLRCLKRCRARGHGNCVHKNNGIWQRDQHFLKYGGWGGERDTEKMAESNKECVGTIQTDVRGGGRRLIQLIRTVQIHCRVNSFGENCFICFRPMIYLLVINTVSRHYS